MWCRDWRSPGEAWVKTDEGSWEKLKILEFSTYNRNHQSGFHSSGDSSTESDSDNEVNCEDSSNSTVTELNKDGSQSQSASRGSLSPLPGTAPYCHITLKSTKEVAAFNTISEAFYRLDFSNAIRDIRRFTYVCKLLHLLINQNLTSLGGPATKILFNMLEQLALQVAHNQQNIHVLQTLLHDLKKIMKKYYCWGRPLGSTILWEQHLATLEKICQMANTIAIKQPADDGSKRLTDLPEELIREILLRLSDYKDLKNSAEAYNIMNSLLDEQHVWRQLCKYHFSKHQVRIATGQFTNADNGDIDFEGLFHFLRRKFGLREEYADSLYLCRHCRCLFWYSLGHPCVVLDIINESKTDNDDQNGNSNNEAPPSPPAPGPAESFILPEHVPVPPQAFLKFFSL